jgi:sugar lactone lactonase YvrE
VFWEGTKDGQTPDGFAVGASGRVYVAAAVANQVLVLGPDGQQIAQVTPSPDVPFDLPGGVAFLGDQLLVTNQAFLGGPQSHQVVFRIDVHDRAGLVYRPALRSS